MFMTSKSVSQIFKMFFQTVDINFFVLRGVFIDNIFKEKAPFPTKKTSAVKSETEFSREAIEN